MKKILTFFAVLALFILATGYKSGINKTGAGKWTFDSIATDSIGANHVVGAVHMNTDSMYLIHLCLGGANEFTWGALRDTSAQVIADSSPTWASLRDTAAQLVDDSVLSSLNSAARTITQTWEWDGGNLIAADGQHVVVTDDSEADSIDIYDDGTNAIIKCDNDLLFKKGAANAFKLGSYNTCYGNFIGNDDTGELYWKGVWIHADYDGDDSLSGFVFNAADSIKYDSVSADFTITNDVIISSGNLTVNGITQFAYVDADIDDTEEYTLSVADGKAGWGMASMGDEWTFFRFTTAAVVTLVNETANVSTTNDQDTDFNIYDGGTSVVFENQLGDDKELNINVWFVP